jgi:esterase/lipase
MDEKLIRRLKGEGYRKIAVLGMSLGSWIAGLIAAHDLAVSKASLFLTAGSLAKTCSTVQHLIKTRSDETDISQVL